MASWNRPSPRFRYSRFVPSGRYHRQEGHGGEIEVELPSLSKSNIATPDPYAVGKCLASVIPETWTKSIPAACAISVNRKD